MEYKITIEGVPVPKARPRLGAWGTYTPKRTKDYEKLIKDTWLLNGFKKPLSGAIAVDIIIYRAIQKNASKDVKEAKKRNVLLPTVKPDLDNYIKSVLDGLNGLAYADDALICDITAAKRYSDRPRVEITIKEIDGGNGGKA